MTKKDTTIPKVIATLLVLLLGAVAIYYFTSSSSDNNPDATQRSTKKPKQQTIPQRASEKTPPKHTSPTTTKQTKEEGIPSSLSSPPPAGIFYSTKNKYPWPTVTAFSMLVVICTILCYKGLKWDKVTVKPHLSIGFTGRYKAGSLVLPSTLLYLQPYLKPIGLIALLAVAPQGGRLFSTTQHHPLFSWRETAVAGGGATFIFGGWNYFRYKKKVDGDNNNREQPPQTALTSNTNVKDGGISGIDDTMSEKSNKAETKIQETIDVLYLNYFKYTRQLEQTIDSLALCRDINYIYLYIKALYAVVNDIENDSIEKYVKNNIITHTDGIRNLIDSNGNIYTNNHKIDIKQLKKDLETIKTLALQLQEEEEQTNINNEYKMQENGDDNENTSDKIEKKIKNMEKITKMNDIIDAREIREKVSDMSLVPIYLTHLKTFVETKGSTLSLKNLNKLSEDVKSIQSFWESSHLNLNNELRGSESSINNPKEKKADVVTSLIVPLGKKLGQLQSDKEKQLMKQIAKEK